MSSSKLGLSRRRFFRESAIFAAGALALKGAAQEIELPFENGRRELVAYPQKRKLIRLTTRPPQLETPFSVFDEGVITPNDAFFVRYHLTLSPPNESVLRPDRFKLKVRGSVKKELTLGISDLKQFDSKEIVAVNQCSGNSRGFFEPRIQGGQSGNGMMGNARWKGIPLKSVLDRAGVKKTARQVTFNGLDGPLIAQTPDFVKALDVDQARDGEVMLAYEMNGEPLPWLNGYPLRLLVPGYYGTYWVKHLNDINVIDEVFNGFWMNPAYRIPDNACACSEPGQPPGAMVPIKRFNVRSFITSHHDKEEIKRGEEHEVRGIAFDGGYGIQQVLFSVDGGHTWREAQLGKELGKYSFREWKSGFKPEKAGEYALKVRAVNRIGQSQPLEPLWNPSGYMRNVVETVKVEAV
jgi:DMSO/TMAO reductase YedYZ molybdopterin-dependent catalytic subunit